MNKTELVKFRCDKDFLKDLDNLSKKLGYDSGRAKGYSKTIRHLIRSSDAPVYDIEKLEEILREKRNLSRLGSNLNQINRYLGLQLELSDDGFFRSIGRKNDDIILTIKDIEDQIKTIKKKLDVLLDSFVTE